MTLLLSMPRSRNPFQIPSYYGGVGLIPDGTYWIVELEVQSKTMYWCDLYAKDGRTTMWAYTTNYAAVFNTKEEAENAAAARLKGVSGLRYVEHIWGG